MKVRQLLPPFYTKLWATRLLKIQINDQGKEFVNEVSNKLLEMTGTEQRVTSAYHPQSNGLCERQNRTIKDSLLKVLEENPEEWPNVIQGVLLHTE